MRSDSEFAGGYLEADPPKVGVKGARWSDFASQVVCVTADLPRSRVKTMK